MIDVLLNGARALVTRPRTQFILIFISVTILYVIPHSEWYFSGEDWGLVARGSTCSGFKDFFDLFLHGKVNNLAPDIVTNDQFVLMRMDSGDTFFNVYFRPLLLAIHVVLFYFFHLNAYLYFVSIVLLHSLSTALLYLILSDFVKRSISLLVTAFFAFHPTLYGWFGRVDTMQNHLNSVFLLILYLSIKNYLQTGYLSFYLFSCFIFFLSLLCRETLIVLPLIILLWVIFNFRIRGKLLANVQYLIVSFAFLIMVYFYMKSLTYPLSLKIPIYSSQPAVEFSLLKKLNTTMAFFYDFFWLQWFPWSAYDFFKANDLTALYKLMKLLLIFFSTVLLISNVHKKIIVLSLTSALLMYWAALFTPRGDIRLFYEALPFVMLALALLLNDSKLVRVKNFFIIVCVILIIGNGCAVIHGMHEMMRMPKKIHYALENLKKSENSLVTQKPLLVMSTHGTFYSCGLIQAIDLYGINKKIPRFFLPDVTIQSCNNYNNIESQIHIERLPNGLRLLSHDPENIWFEANHYQNTKEFLRITVQIDTYGINGRIVSLNLMSDGHWLHPDVIVLLLLFQQERFVFFTCKS